MHGIGKLYIMTRAAQHPDLFVDDAALNEILDCWHASIGKAILENWEFSDETAAAVGEQEDHSREEEVEPDLRDVIAIAILMVAHSGDHAGIELALNGLPGTIRLGLDEARIAKVLEECATEVSALSDALGA